MGMEKKEMKMYVTESFRDFIMTNYPAVEKSLKYKKFLHYLCFSIFYDEDYKDQLVIPAKLIWELCIKQKQNEEYNKDKFVFIDFLEKFKTDVLPNLQWSRYGVGKSRRITDFGFDQNFNLMLDNELFNFDKIEKKVHFINGMAKHKKTSYEYRECNLQKYEEVKKDFQLNETQNKIISYLEQVNCGKSFLTKFDKNRKLIMNAIDNITNINSKRIQYRIINSVLDDPQVYYKPSEKRCTARVTASEDSIVGLKSTVRKAWMSGYLECDLKSSQFSILSEKIQATQCLEFIKTGKSIWSEMYRHTHNIENTEPPIEIKKIFKQVLYSICFGKSIEHSSGYYFLQDKNKKNIQEDLKTICKNNKMDNLLSHYLIKELLDKRKVWYDKIDKDKGDYDVWGRFVSISKDRWAGSVGAEVIQSYEMQIISKIFDIANMKERYMFQIVCFQHDGATLSIFSQKQKEYIKKALSKAVEEEALKYNILTKLEFTQL